MFSTNRGQSYWYRSILPSESTFPLSCRRTLIDFITSMGSHLSNKRTADTFLQFLINSSSVTIVFLSELSAAFEVASPSMTPEQTVKRYLELSPESSLANVLDRQQQLKKLNMVADDILSGFIDRKAYECSAVRDFFREVLAGVVLESTISSLSRPEFINGWIIHIFSEGESEIMSAIDAGVEGARNQAAGIPKSSNDIPRSSTVNTVEATSSGIETPSETAYRQSDDTDKATEDALSETKRLSDIMATQTAQGQGSRDGPGILPGDRRYSQQSDMQSPVIDTAPGSAPRLEQPPSSQAPSNSSNQTLRKEDDKDVTVLHLAAVSVDDGSPPGDKGVIKSKPASNYLIQIEPVSSRSTGWMIFRKYADFESLHPTLETISRLNRIQGFTDQHPALPMWNGLTKQEFARKLERYLQDALQHEPLAESGRMKRFLEKESQPGDQFAKTSAKSGFFYSGQTAFENMGKGVMGALSNANKGMAGGSKAVFDGVTGAFGTTTTNKRTPSPIMSEKDQASRDPSIDRITRQVEGQYTQKSSFDRNLDTGSRPLSPPTGEIQGSATGSHSSAPIGSVESPLKRENSESPAVGGWDLPPCESAMNGGDITKSPNGSVDKEYDQDISGTDSEMASQGQDADLDDAQKHNRSITTEETQVAVELIFAVINELYSLSSAWNIRKTLLNTAKSYILRPGSPNLDSIRELLQESMIDAHTSDEAMAHYLAKLRENALPTEGELEAWPPSPSEAEQERLRSTARKLFVQRGIPRALMSVMGAAASREALEKIFDCLQVETVARGLVFSVLMQALRAVIL